MGMGRRLEWNWRRVGWAVVLLGGGAVLLGITLFQLGQDGDPALRFEAAPADVPYALAPILPDGTFDRPVGLVPLPGAADAVVVPTQDGRIWVLSLSGAAPPTVVGDIATRLIQAPDVEEGLVGLAFSPAFPEDRRLYLAYTAAPPRRSVVARFRVADDGLAPDSEEVILAVPEPSSTHNVGQLAFGPDGYLYIGFGDGGSDGDALGHAQDLGTLHGAILRIDVASDSYRYRIPPDNPFVDRPDARAEIYAYGLRNPWRFAFDRTTGALWAGDVGEVGWEEVNQILPGANYGWNVREGGECVQARRCTTSGLTPPRAVYGRDHGCAIIGGAVYRGRALPELVGRYIYGDFCSGSIWAVATTGTSRPIRLAQTGVAIVSFGELPDGEVVVLSYSGALYRLQHEVPLLPDGS